MERVRWLRRVATGAADGLWRSLDRDRRFAVIGLGGLALGIAAALLLLLYVQAERGVGRSLPGWERVWQVRRTLHLPGLAEVVAPPPPALLGQIVGDFPGTTGTRLLHGKATLRTANGAAAITLGQADADYLALFPIPALAGDAGHALATPDGAAVSARIARDHLGGVSAAVGRTLTLVVGGHPRLVRVQAVLADVPGQTYPVDVLAALHPTGSIDLMGSEGLEIFLRLAPDQATRLAAAFPAFSRRHPDPDLAGLPPGSTKQVLVPLAQLHLFAARDRALVAVLALVAAAVLLVAVVNHVGLATARAGRRVRELALRRVFGASRRLLVAQLVAEAVGAVALAALIGLALAEVALPALNAAAGSDLQLHYAGPGAVTGPLLLLVLLVGLIAGLWPARVLVAQATPAALSLGAAAGRRSGRRGRQWLVAAQFAVAAGLLTATALLFAQERHLARADFGYDRAGLVLVPSFSDPGLDAGRRAGLLLAIARLPGVVGAAQSGIAPGGGSFSAEQVRLAGSGRPATQLIGAEVGPGLLELYRVHPLAGRLLDADRFGLDEQGDGPAGGANLLLNRKAVHVLGLGSPAAAIGRAVRLAGQAQAATVVGVVPDLRFGGPQDPVEPALYRLRSRGLGGAVLSVRFVPDDMAAGIARLRAMWRQRAPDVPFAALPADQELRRRFAGDIVRARLFLWGAGLATAIGCLGLYGLAAADAGARVREVGVRKALGARTGDIMRLLLAGLLRPVVAGLLVAALPMLVLARRWLAGYDEHVRLTPALFAAPALLVLAVATATVVGQAWQAARRRPAAALRHE